MPQWQSDISHNVQILELFSWFFRNLKDNLWSWNTEMHEEWMSPFSNKVLVLMNLEFVLDMSKGVLDNTCKELQKNTNKQ